MPLKPLCTSTRGISLRQQLALRRLKSRGTNQLCFPRDLKSLVRHFEIYNDLYFGGLLTGCCDIRYYEHGDPSSRGYALQDYSSSCVIRHAGTNDDALWGLGTPEATISIGRDWSSSAVSQVLGYHGKLLHQILHALFLIYCCPLDKEGSEQGMHEAAKRHHVSWNVAAYALELCFQNQEPDYLLERELGMAVDMQMGYKLPSEPEFRLVGLDFKRILLLLECLRKEKAKKAE